MSFPLRALVSATVAVAVSGCATYAPQRGLDETQRLAAERGLANAPIEGPGDCSAGDADLGVDLQQPLAAESAVRVALLCNPGLAAEYARLGISRAEAFQAGRVANPTVSASVLDSSEGGNQIGLGLTQSFSSLILRGPRQRLAEGEFLRAQQLLAGAVLALAAEVKSAYFDLLAAQQVARLRESSADAARISAELAQRFRDAGNITARELALRQATAAEAAAEARQARNAQTLARTKLQRLLGLPVARDWSLPDAIPYPAREEDARENLQASAAKQRLDLVAAQKLVELLADQAGVERKFRWLGDLDLGVEYEREADRSRLLGPTLSIQLPLFDRGAGKAARAASLADWSRAERRRLALEVDTAVDLAARKVASARDQVEDSRAHLVPQREAVVARTQEEVNFMLLGAFDLIDARRDQLAAYVVLVDALRDYWQARAELEQASGARLPSDARLEPGGLDMRNVLEPPQDMGGMHHGMHHDHGAAPQPASGEHEHGEAKRPREQHEQHEHPDASHERHDDQHEGATP